MTPEDYRRAGQLFERVSELPESERASALDEACGGNAELRQQVWSLLEADSRAGSFLEGHALEDAAKLVTSNLPPARVLSPGARFGPYQITALLGAGGMGEVYRAHDTKLHRDVAIKVLPAMLANDAQYMARFEREAQVLASLNHPNIATVYGIEQGSLVMELVEGENLHGPLPLDEVIPVARQIAQGLEAAHERGIVHRDLKPANIKITPAGVVKLLDFGLAKSAADAADSPRGGSTSPVPSPLLTQLGMIVGTAAYMSPEQARGKAVDKRTDIWAFGVVLYEMLTGQRPFAGKTTADTLAAVVKESPNLEALPVETPLHLRRLLARCLRKDANTRLRDIGEARVQLDEPDQEPRSALPRGLKWLAVFASLTVVGLTSFWLARPAQDTRTLRLSVAAPDNASFWNVSLPAVSPDGRHLAFAARTDRKSQIWVRDLDALTARVLPGTDGAFDPFWSPDSRFIGFFVPGKMKRADLGGSPVLTICDAPDGRGGTWNRNDVILFAPSFGSSLSRVAASGGTPVPLTALDEAASETSHRFPSFLPDGRHYLFSARSEDSEKTGIYVGDLLSEERRFLFAAPSNAVYSPPGFLLFLRGSKVMAQPFDLSTLRANGDPRTVVEQADYLPGNLQGQFAVSANGVLAYFSGGGGLKSQMTWIDRDGKPVGKVGTPATMQAPAISSDGKRIAVDRLDPERGTYDLWLFEIANGAQSRFTFDPGNETFPVWSPDGSRLLFSSTRKGKYGLYTKGTTGEGQEQLLYETTGVTLPTSWRGHFALFYHTDPKTGDDLWVMPSAGDRNASIYLQTKASESQARLSPDGKWLAYESNESGMPAVYVQAFPSKQAAWQVSPEGGSRPVWSGDGEELFYIASDSKMMAIKVSEGISKFQYRMAKPLFTAQVAPTAQFDVTKDGQRFLMLYPGESGATAQMNVVVNWSNALPR